MIIKPKVLFVCVGNSCRSQMSEGFARSLAGDTIEVFSAGSRPMGIVHPSAVEAMRAVGIDISRHRSKGLSQIPQEKYDCIVTMGCGDACPQIPARKRIDWQIPDPVSGDAQNFERVRDLIQTKVQELIRKEFLPNIKK